MGAVDPQAKRDTVVEDSARIDAWVRRGQAASVDRGEDAARGGWRAPRRRRTSPQTLKTAEPLDRKRQAVVAASLYLGWWTTTRRWCGQMPPFHHDEAAIFWRSLVCRRIMGRRTGSGPIPLHRVRSPRLLLYRTPSAHPRLILPHDTCSSDPACLKAWPRWGFASDTHTCVRALPSSPRVRVPRSTHPLIRRFPSSSANLQPALALLVTEFLPSLLLFISVPNLDSIHTTWSASAHGPAVLGTGFLLHRQAHNPSLYSLPWDQARWRDVHSHHFPSERVHAAPAPPLAAPTAINPSSQSVILGGYQHESHAWQRNGLAAIERDMTAKSSSAGDPIHTPSYNNRTEDRQTPPDSKTNRSQALAGISPPFEPPSDGWRPLHQPYQSASAPHIANTPLTLHIPRQDTVDLHRTSPAHDDSLQGRRAQTTTHQSLPSFATFSEHTANRKVDPDVDGPEIAPMASRLSCHSCNKLKPQLRELALAAAEVDENVQNVFNRPLIRVRQISRCLHESINLITSCQS
ncbi:hypothetical protein KC363_g9 [Hortaea werneckii]|nr:hypothetical protein KC363_g9 [Hortaea werneckii]